SIGISVPAQNPVNPFTVPDYTSPGDFDPRRPDTPVTAAAPEREFNTSVRDRAAEAGLRTNKITPDVIAAAPETAFNTSVRDRVAEAGLPTNKIAAEAAAAPQRTGVATNVRDRVAEAGLPTNKIAADGPASFQGFVKGAKGEPSNGASLG